MCNEKPRTGHSDRATALTVLCSGLVRHYPLRHHPVLHARQDAWCEVTQSTRGLWVLILLAEGEATFHKDRLLRVGDALLNRAQITKPRLRKRFARESARTSNLCASLERNWHLEVGPEPPSLSKEPTRIQNNTSRFLIQRSFDAVSTKTIGYCW